MDAILPSGHVGDMFEPPLVVQADVAMAPFAGSHAADITFEIREIQQPIIALASDSGRVVPVVVAFTIGSKMNVADRRFTGSNFLVAYEALPQVLIPVKRSNVFSRVDSTRCPNDSSISPTPRS